jgi:hypothetical protein
MLDLNEVIAVLRAIDAEEDTVKVACLNYLSVTPDFIEGLKDPANAQGLANIIMQKVLLDRKPEVIIEALSLLLAFFIARASKDGHEGKLLHAVFEMIKEKFLHQMVNKAGPAGVIAVLFGELEELVGKSEEKKTKKEPDSPSTGPTMKDLIAKINSLKSEGKGK